MKSDVDDPATARALLLKRCRRNLWLRRWYSKPAMVRRISRMTDQQVSAALSLSRKEFRVGVKAKPVEDRWAPAVSDGAPVILWDHPST
ncbi:hypothetical protein [Streptomyces yangpuensis]|uniref:hypothetical protein n=1 Tax=Streptomyces yangpuensis TaxID=1648182 RepID=UPI0035DF6BE1